MHDLASTFRAVEYIEAHLQADVTVAEMAEAAGYSLYHFIRAFNEDTHYTPYDYLMRRRLSQAARDLLTSDARVLDIALAYRFNSHETFSRAFKRLLGLQPVQWRECGKIPYRALTPPLTLPYLEHIHRPNFPRPQIITLETRHLAGLMSPLPADLGRLTTDFQRLTNFQAEKNVLWRVICHAENGAAYGFVGAETTGTVLPPLATLTLPAATYLCLAHIGPSSAIPLTCDHLVHTWLQKTGRRMAYPFEIELHSPQQPIQISIPLR